MLVQNFIGLSALDGYIACGSETNEVRPFRGCLILCFKSVFEKKIIFLYFKLKKIGAFILFSYTDVKKKIILMYFWMKNTFKNNLNHTLKQALINLNRNINLKNIFIIGLFFGIAFPTFDCSCLVGFAHMKRASRLVRFWFLVIIINEETPDQNVLIMNLFFVWVFGFIIFYQYICTYYPFQ